MPGKGRKEKRNRYNDDNYDTFGNTICQSVLPTYQLTIRVLSIVVRCTGQSVRGAGQLDAEGVAVARVSTR